MAQKLPSHVATTNIDGVKPASDLERHLREAATIPGPGAYGAPSPLYPNSHGVKFGKGQYVSDIDWKMRDAAKKPGPGQYVLSGVPDVHRLPQTDKDWKAHVSYYPEMRYREN